MELLMRWVVVGRVMGMGLVMDLIDLWDLRLLSLGLRHNNILTLLHSRRSTMSTRWQLVH